jgi:uncharacterized protein (DUF2225 family)
MECPVCGSENEFQIIKPGAYMENERDTDFCPKKLSWSNPLYQNINPLVYFMATCHKCFYTHELNKEYQEWKKNKQFKLTLPEITKRHLEKLNRENGLVKKMGVMVFSSNDLFSKALIKFFVGIYDEILSPQRSFLNLARYYLRVGWLFREKEEKGYSFWLNLSAASPDPAILERKLFWIKSLHRKYSQKLAELVEIANRFYPDESDETNKDNFLSIVENMQSSLQPLKSSLDQLLSFKSSDKKLGYIREVFSEGFFKDFDLAQFLSYLKKRWSKIPLNEKEALQSSLKYHQKAYVQVRERNQKIRISYLMGDLSRRIGDLEGASKYFDQAITISQKEIEKNEKDFTKIALAQKVLKLAGQQKEKISISR